MASMGCLAGWGSEGIGIPMRILPSYWKLSDEYIKFGFLVS